MKRDFPLYEGDGIIRRPVEGPLVDFIDLELRARRNRALAVAGLFARMFEWIDASVRRARYHELEKYLGQSKDLADLERRLRDMGLERRDALTHG